MIDGKRILVTGGTGSFGEMFIRELLNLNPKEIVVFSRDEDKHGRMKLEYNNSILRFVLGDVRDYRSIRNALRGIDVVVHAAALKWISEVELNVWEGVKTNVIGAQNIIEAARDENVQKVVALSTDKAVEPVNAYGMTKALQERLITTANLYNDDTQTAFVSTRCGNVLGSRGSVVPLFRSLIDQRKPITITDASMTRFLITLKESVGLILKAMEKGIGGEIFVPNMPAHTVGDLAEVMLENLPKSQRRIVNIGVRPGEKIHEMLISSSESRRTVSLDDYYVILPQIDMPPIREKYQELARLGDTCYASNTVHRLTKKELHRILEKEGWI